MRVFVLLGFAAATLPYYGHAADPPATPPAQPHVATPSSTTTTGTTVATPSATAIAGIPPENIRTIEIDPNAPQPVCKRVVPTGSRIAERRCETPQTTARAEADRAVLRQDFQTMRDQQMLREQARQAAMAEAMRRRSAQQ